MHFIELTYLIASVAAVIAMAPQIKTLLVTKQSDELNLSTWMVWASYQVVALMYSISLGAIPYLIANIAWLMFYAVMLTLIVKYRKNTPVPVIQEVADLK